jgi:predicted Ser/Thr protein kinase
MNDEDEDEDEDGTGYAEAVDQRQDTDPGDAGDAALYAQLRAAVREPADRSKRLPGEFGRYSKVTLEKEGGMGDFYRAYDKVLEKDVGLKTVKGTSPEQREELKLEAKMASRISDDAVATIYDIDWYDGQPIIRMEYVHGHPLSDAPWTKPRTRTELTKIVEPLLIAARALVTAHSRSVFHGDFKPANVMLANNGQLKLIDFGLGRRADLPAFDDPRARGTLPYMAPEQTLGKVTAQTDMYSFGVVLHERLTGELPIAAEPRDWAQAIRHQPPKPANEVNPKVGRGLSAIVARCLAKNPKDRYKEMGEVVADLENWLNRRELIAWPEPFLLKVVSVSIRHPIVSAIVGAIVVCAGIVFAILVPLHTKDRRNLIVGEMATQVLLGAADYEHLLEGTADALRQAPSPAITILVAAWNAAAKVRPPASLQDLLARPERQRVQEALMDLKPLSRGGYWLVFDASGKMIARAPDTSKNAVVGLDFHNRDYFIGAKKHVGLGGMAAIHVSNAYESLADGNFKYTFSTPLVAADGDTVGVLAASSSEKTKLGFEFMVVAARDQNQFTSAPGDGHQLVVVEHPHGARGITFFSRQLAPLAVRAECGHEFDRRSFAPEARFLSEFHDPAHDIAISERSMASVAPVASTGFIVLTTRNQL